jgi:acetyl-CoA C-acetyltransferase
LVSSRLVLVHHVIYAADVDLVVRAGAQDEWNPLERRTYTESPAMNLAVSTALDRANLTADDIDACDLYSCFPSAIQLGLTALGTDHTDRRQLSLTGGLAFAGGPGNAYVLHSLTAALRRVRNHPRDRILVTGIGMANTKQAATVLTGGERCMPGDVTGSTSYREPSPGRPRPVADTPCGLARLVSYTIEYDRRGQQTNVIFILDLEDGRRTIANAAEPAVAAAQLTEREPIGRTGSVHHDTGLGRNLFAFTAG